MGSGPGEGPETQDRKPEDQDAKSPGHGARRGLGPVASSQGPGPEVQDAESPGPGTSSQVRGAHGRRRGATSPVRRAHERAMRTGMMMVGVRNVMMIVLLLMLYLRSVGNMLNHMMFRWAF